MTKEEMTETLFNSNMIIKYSGKKYQLMSIDFIEYLLGLKDDTNEDILWVRCENAELCE